MKAVILDSIHFTSKRTAHEYIAAQLNFPAHYGHNLDALADCLSELPHDVCVVMIERTGAVYDPVEYIRQIADVFHEILGSKKRFVQIQC